MQPGHLTSYEETSFPDQPKKELKEELGNTVIYAVSGLYDEAKKGAIEIAADLSKLVKNMENAPFILKNLLDSQPAIGPEAFTLYQLTEQQKLTFQTVLENCTLKVTGVKECDLSTVDIGQQRNILLELEQYLGKWIKLAKVFQALKWPFGSVAILWFLISICQSDNPRKELAKKVIHFGVRFSFGFIGSKIGALIGALGGPIGTVVGWVIGGMIGGIIGRYCGKRIFKEVCLIFFPNYTGGPGQAPIIGTEHTYGQPCIRGAVASMKQTEVQGLLPKCQPKIAGTAAAFGLPKLLDI